MIEIKNLTKKFGKFIALNDVSLSLLKSDSIALIGPNGCGKTTLIKCILNMVIPDGGEILFENKSIKNQDDYRKHIGYMPQIGRYPENMNIGQVIDMIIELRNKNNDYETDTELIESYNLKSMYHKKMNTLSGGTRQKVSAVLAFLFNPKVLILDEPTAGLDHLAVEILKEKIIKERENGKLILITSHQLSDLNELITKIVFMQESKVLFQKNIEDLLKLSGQETISKAITYCLKNNITS